MPSPLGDKLRALRQQKKLSLEQLAELTESSKSYIWELENKDAPNPSADSSSPTTAGGIVVVVLEVELLDAELLLVDVLPEEVPNSTRMVLDPATPSCFMPRFFWNPSMR